MLLPRILGLAALLSLAGVAVTQSQDANLNPSQLRQELARLRADLDSLKQARLQSETTTDEMDALEDRLDNRMRELESKIDAVSRVAAATAFNPRTTAFLNFAGRIDDVDVHDPGGDALLSNRMFLRTVEVDLRAAVDPYAEAVAIISLEDEAGHGFSIDAEEAYGLLKRLPVIESAPLGVKVKVGKFRAPLGGNNKLHMHDLPWITRPLVVSTFLGTEHGDFFEAGFNPTGVDFDFFLPSIISGTTFEMNADVIRSGELGLSTQGEIRQPAYVGHLTLSKDWSNEHLLLLGGSAYTEVGKDRAQLFGLDLTYKWTPAERSQRQSLVLGGEVFFARQYAHDEEVGDIVNTPKGWFGYAQYQLSYWTYLGARYDWVESPKNSELVTNAWSGYISYYTTEFLRFRLGFERRQHNLAGASVGTTNTGLFEINFVFGSHPTEPYWVNR
jgi:hypothetical protein